MPDEFTFAVAFRPVERLMVSTDMTWMRWSGYLPQIMTPVSFKQSLIKPDFKDTLIPRIGIEYRMFDDLYISGGYSFQKSPVPDQPAYTNFVDNDRHVVAFGLEWVYRGFRVQGFFQYHHAVERFFRKDPGYGPSFYAGGRAYGFGFNVSAAF